MRDAAAGIGDDQFNKVAANRRCPDIKLFDQRVSHGFSRIIDQIDDDTLELFPVDIHLRQTRREILAHFDIIQSPGEYR